jgi:hypothetical protein
MHKTLSREEDDMEDDCIFRSQLACRSKHVLRAVTISLAALAMVLTAALRPALAEPPAGCDPPPDRPRLDQTRPNNLGELKRQLVYYRCTRYDRDVSKVLNAARTWIERRAGRVKKPALVLDIDETSLSNWKQLYHNDFGFILQGGCDFRRRAACGQEAWERSAGGTAIQPTLDLFSVAKTKHVAVFFITGRREEPSEREATESNLRKAGYDGWEHLYMRPLSSKESSVAPYKSSARADIESKGYTIIANVGDQESDLMNGHAQRRFKVPNPYYYIP